MRSVVLVLIVVLRLVLTDPVHAQQLNLSEFLPDAASIGTGVVVTDQGVRTLEDIAGTFADPADAQERLIDWGWQEQSFRYFGAPDPIAPLTSLEVSLHRFSSFQNATAAFPYFLDSRAAALGLEETPVVINRARAQAIAGAVAEGQEATIYVLLDTVLARVTAISATDDPLPYAKKVTQIVVDQSFTSSASGPETRPARTAVPSAPNPSSTSRAQDAATSVADCERAIRVAYAHLVQMPLDIASAIVGSWKYGDTSGLGIPADCNVPENAPVLVGSDYPYSVCLWWSPQTNAATGGPIATSSGGAPLPGRPIWECYSITVGWFYPST